MSRVFRNLLVLILFALPLGVLAQSANYTSQFNVYNYSQQNVDATTVTANPGDILMYEVLMEGSAPVSDEPVTVQMNDAQDLVTIIDGTELTVENGNAVFQTVTDGNSNWNRTFRFQVRVVQSPSRDTITMFHNGIQRDVKINLETPQTGPDMPSLAIAIALILLFSIIMFFSRRKA